VAFLTICLAVVVAFIGGTWMSARRDPRTQSHRTIVVSVGTILWLSLILVVVWTGWLEGDPRRVLAFAASMNAVSLGIGFSPIGRWLAAVPCVWLVAFQGFRFPLELVLHSWAAQGVIPGTMTWTGRNWDIISGVSALILAPLCRRSRVWAWLANGIGLVLLMNVVRVALLSSPVPFGWPVVPKLALIYHFPYVLIVPVCVGGALIGHIALSRALMTEAEAKRS
jgi:hypothetical protein